MTTNGKRGDEEERSEVSSLKKTKRKASKQEKKVQMGMGRDPSPYPKMGFLLNTVKFTDSD